MNCSKIELVYCCVAIEDLAFGIQISERLEKLNFSYIAQMHINVTYRRLLKLILPDVKHHLGVDALVEF